MGYVSAFGAGLLVAVAVLGCSTREDESTARSLVSDSAGVLMVTTTGADRPLATRQVMHVGVIEGDPDLQFDRIRSIAIDSAGDFWVSDSHESIRHYDRSGTFLGALGREGSGPGEAAGGYGDVWVNRGTVIALGYPATLQAFAADGSFLGSRSARPAPGVFLTPLGASGSSWTYHVRGLPPPAGAAQATRGWTIVAGALDEEALDTVVSLAGERLRASPLGGWAPGSYFEGSPAVQGDQDGRIYYSHPVEYRVEVYGADGQLRQVVSRQTSETPYPEGLRDEVEAGVRQQLRRQNGEIPVHEGQVEDFTTRALPLSPPEHIPYIESLLVSGDGHIWVFRADRHPRPAMRAVASAFGLIRPAWADEWRAPAHVDLFNPDGTYRGSIQLPDEFLPMAVTQDMIIGSEYDELQVEYVVAYAITEQL